jgi:uncharacterized protein DUF4410
MKSIVRRGIVAAIFLSVVAAGPMLQAEEQKPAKIKASAIKVEMIRSDEIKLPAEFQVALYEDLIQQLQKKAGFQQVYRQGDRNAEKAADLVILHSTVTGFKKGNEELRQVTTVAGATSIRMHCVFKDKEGKALLESDVTGKVRFFGGNLRATYDFAKKTAQIAHDHFSPTAGT